MDYSRSMGRADFIGGIDNEALDFGPLEPFVHVSSTNGISNAANNCTAAITLSVTAITTTTTPTQIPLVSASDSPAAMNINATTCEPPSHLPESPPDSGSEPPYSPADLHAMNTLNQPYHNHSLQSASQHIAQQQHGISVGNHCATQQMRHPHQIGEVNLIGGNSNMNQSTNTIHKTEDILLSSTIAAAPVTSVMNMPVSELILQPSSSALLDLGMQPQHQQMGHLRGIYRNENGNNLLSMVPPGSDQLNPDDLNYLMSNAIYLHPTQQHPVAPASTNLLFHHTPQQQQANQPSQQNPQQQHMIASRKRQGSNVDAAQPHQQHSSISMAQHQQLHRQDDVDLLVLPLSGKFSLPDGGTDELPIKRSMSAAPATPLDHRVQPSIKPEPDTLSPLCVSGLVDSPISTRRSVSSSPPVSTSIVVESPEQQHSSNQQQQQQGGNSDGSCNESCPMQCIRFSPFQQQSWHILCDQSLQELPMPHYRVDADKGFNFSNSDDAFVCQKKNHFQITCHAQLQGAAAIFVRTDSGLEKIKSFHLHFYGVKLEAPTQMIRVEQSQSDRSKKPFHPVPIDLQNRQVSKVTVGRLHFSETTSNNMRKKGRPNPEQRYFQLVVGLHAHTHSGHFPLVSQGSERIIVRASNPGQFENDVELCWQRGVTPESIFHAGRVGINTDRPDESLVVHGNLKISGHIVQPSDSRAKREIGELDTSQQLQNVKRIRVVKYRYEPEFAVHHGLAALPNVHSTKFDKNGRRCDGTAGTHDNFAAINGLADVIDTGVIAQEVREVLPDAVQEAGSVLLPSGEVIDNFLLVNKDRIYMENIGAVKELCKVTGSLETRIEQLERMNSRLVQIKKIGHHKSDCVHLSCKAKDCREASSCSNKMIQIVIVVLVIIMAVCLAAISTLYFVEHNNQFVYNGAVFRTLPREMPSNNDVGGGGGTANGFDPVSWRHSNNRKLSADYPAFTQSHHSEKKIPFSKSILHNNFTTNYSRAAGAPIASSSQRTLPLGQTTNRGNGIEPTTEATDETAKHQASDDLNKVYEYEENPLTNSSNYMKRAKVQQSADVLRNVPTLMEPQRSETSPELIVPIGSEPQQDLNWTAADNSYLLTDVDTNFIDVGQRNAPRNNSKLEDKTLIKSRTSDESDLISLHAIQDTIFEREYKRERRIEQPIGLPSHCAVIMQYHATPMPGANVTAGAVLSNIETTQIPSTSTSMLDIQSSASQTTYHSQCPSTCSKDSLLNHSPDIAEAPEISIPENVDLGESSTASAAKLSKASETNEDLSTPENQNTTSNATYDSSTTNDQKSSAIDGERPIEIKESSTSIITEPLPTIASAAGTVSFASLLLQPFPMTSNSSILLADSQSSGVLTAVESTAALSAAASNDINGVYNKKLQPSIFEVLTDDMSKNESAEIAPMLTGPAAVPIESDCFPVHVMAHADSFNVTLGTDEICPHSDGGGYNFNITYHIPISQYMKENRFDLVFAASTVPLNWRLCSTKQRMGKDHHDDPTNIGDEASTFEVKMPPFGHFEIQMEFKAHLGPSNINVCRLPTAGSMNSVQLVLYKLNIYRDCN